MLAHKTTPTAREIVVTMTPEEATELKNLLEASELDLGTSIPTLLMYLKQVLRCRYDNDGDGDCHNCIKQKHSCIALGGPF